MELGPQLWSSAVALPEEPLVHRMFLWMAESIRLVKGLQECITEV